MNYLANSLTIKPQMHMLSSSVARAVSVFGEALGMRIDKTLDKGSRITIDEKAWRGEIHDCLNREKRVA